MLILLAKADYTHPNPTAAQQEAGNYAKRKVVWRGLTISVENEKGAFRTGTAKDGTTWSRPMHAAYGYINRTMGVDGDQVDCYLGPDLDAPNVFVVHQRRYGDWDKYGEDKVMVGWPDEAAARAAYLKQYDDPRFLGEITAMPAEVFVEKVKATKAAPAMIKALLFTKGHVGAYVRRGRIVSGYTTDRTGPQVHQQGQGDLFAPRPGDASGDTLPRRHYVTVARGRRMGWLAGPFEHHEQALAHVEAARTHALSADPFCHFDLFGTSSFCARVHKPGVLNGRMGLSTASQEHG